MWAFVFRKGFMIIQIKAAELNISSFYSFVMGEKTASLRGKRLSDLIHGASINKPVTVTFLKCSV